VRLVLLGDSHLARVRRDLHRLRGGGSTEVEIVNAAVGGAFVSDLAEQALEVGLQPGDRVAVSVGTNDAAPWKQIPLD
jgi:hypothetical protein